MTAGGSLVNINLSIVDCFPVSNLSQDYYDWLLCEMEVIIPYTAFSVSMRGGEISEWHVKDPEIYRARTSWKSESRCQSIFFAVPQPPAEEWGLALPVPMSRMRRQRETATSDRSWTHAAVRFPVHGCCSNFFSVTSTNLGQRWNSEECLHNTFCPLECLAGEEGPLLQTSCRVEMVSWQGWSAVSA